MKSNKTGSVTEDQAKRELFVEMLRFRKSFGNLPAESNDEQWGHAYRRNGRLRFQPTPRLMSALEAVKRQGETPQDAFNRVLEIGLILQKGKAAQ